MTVSELVELYERDFYTWTQHQAGALRRAAAERVNTSELIDWENLAEEVEDLARLGRRNCARGTSCCFSIS